jgi:hypothetical protein
MLSFSSAISFMFPLMIARIDALNFTFQLLTAIELPVRNRAFSRLSSHEVPPADELGRRPLVSWLPREPDLRLRRCRSRPGLLAAEIIGISVDGSTVAKAAAAL